MTLIDVNVYDAENNEALLQRVRLQYIPMLVFYDRAGNSTLHIGVLEPDALREQLAEIERSGLMDLDLTLIQSTSLLAYLIVFAGGVLTSLGPCNVATIPLIVGYVGGSHDMSRSRAFVLSFSFAVGLAITFMLLGHRCGCSSASGSAAVPTGGTTWWPASAS